MTRLSFPLLKGLRTVLPKPVKERARRALRTMAALTARVHFTVGVQPVSPVSGQDRGTPLNRYYLAQFLHEFSSDIAGSCLEFQEDLYTSRFGGEKVAHLDILHQEAGNPKATIVADLTTPNAMPSQAYDCIICTYVLHVIFELDTAVSELYRLLKPGGVLLVAVPHIGRSRGQWHELWRFTPDGLHRLLARAFGAEQVIVRAAGNSLTAAGIIRGLAAEDFTTAELDHHHDPDFAVGLFARACKRHQAT
jgi:SAM-dependent methyltransferase